MYENDEIDVERQWISRFDQ